MRKQWIARLLALVLALALCAIPALAQTEGAGLPAEGEASEEGGPAGEEGGKDAAEEPPASSGTIVVEPGAPTGNSAMDDELVFTGEDDFRYLAFEDLKAKVLEGSLTARMLEESIASIDAMDYTRMYQELSSQMSSLEAAQMMYAQIPVSSPMEGAMQGFVISNLASSYASLNSTVTDLATGKLQKDAAAARRQLKNAQDLTVVGAESLYFAILELEQTKGTLQRNLAALNRSQIGRAHV